MQTRPTKSIITDSTPKKNSPKPSANGTSILTEALRLYDRGFWIVPCKDKKAIVEGWNERRLSREALYSALKGTRWNIGMVLNQSDLMDVECDTEEAEVALQAMFTGKIPQTPTWQSKRGKHRLFRRPSDLPEKAKLEIDGVEFRIGNKGALSIIPPSIHPDGPKYEWMPGLSILDLEPANLPASIVERLRSPESPAEPAGESDIPEGQRNDALFKLACKLAKAKLSFNELETALLVHNAAHCKPPLPDTEVAEIVKSALTRAEERPTNAALLLELATANVEYWHTPDSTAFATISRDGHQEHRRVRSSMFKQWLARQFYEAEKRAIGSQTLADALTTLEGRACFDGEEHSVFIRVAGCEDRIYLDLGDDTWQVVEIDANGWRLVADPPVRFRRTKGMLPLPMPNRGGSVEELRSFVNVTDDGWPLLLGWLVAAFRPSGPYPILKLLGEQGSAKTTTAEVLRKLIDPNPALLRRPPKSDRDLMIAANNGWLIAFDNLSYVAPDLSDALCSLATGGGFETRTLFTDEDETILVAERPILLNGIEDPGIRSDLVDRSIATTLPVIDEGNRKAEDDFWREFDEACPRILGALLDAVVVALRELPNVKRKGGQWPRMADFAQWAVAAETALGLKPGTFLHAYYANRQTANDTVLESSPVVRAIFDALKVSRSGTLEGTATWLLAELESRSDVDKRAKGWPKAPRALSGILNRLAPSLRLAGYRVEQGYRGKDRIWTISCSGSSGCVGLPRKPGENAPTQAADADANGKSTDATPSQRRSPKMPEKQSKPTQPMQPEQKSTPNLKPLARRVRQ